MSDGSDGSEKDSEEEEEEEEEGEEETGSSSVATWDPKNSHASYYTFDKKKRIATYTCGSSSWYGTAVGKKTNQFSLKLGSSCTYFMFGFADASKINKSASNYSSGGHYYYPSGSCLYGVGSVGSFQGLDNNQGSIYGMKYDSKKGEISIYKEGKLVGVAFKGIKKIKNLGPALDAYYQNSTYEFVKGKFSKK